MSMGCAPDDRAVLVAALRDRFLAAQLAADRRAALHVVLKECLEAGLTIPEIHLGVIQAAQYEIGRRWLAADVSIGEEHVATAIAQLAIVLLDEQLPRARRRGTSVVLACPAGERHELGGRILTDLLEVAGYDVCYAGADVPTESLIHLVTLRRPRVVALSVSLPSALTAAHDATVRLRADFGAELVIVVGGQAVRGLGAGWPDDSARVITSDGEAAVAALDAIVDRGAGVTVPGEYPLHEGRLG